MRESGELVMRFFLFWIVVVSCSVGCASTNSRYAPTNAPSGELRWAYDSGLRVLKDGREVSTDDWSGLEANVSCVPKAAEYASVARGQAVAASALTWTGVGTMAVGTGAGLGMILGGGEGAVLPGVAVAVGSLVVGPILSAIGLSQRRDSLASGLDAFNVYNDRFQREVACQGSRGTVKRSAGPPSASP